MESDNIIYCSDKYSVLAEEVYNDTDGLCFELRLILNVLDCMIAVTHTWIYTDESLRKAFNNMNNKEVEDFFYKEV